MSKRRALLAVCMVGALTWSIGLAAQSKEDKKKEEARRKEIQAVMKVVDDVVAGQPAPNDVDLKWVRADVLKAQGNKQYVPFTITLDPAKVPGGQIALYWRVVSKDAPAAAAAPAADPAAKKDDKTKDKKPVYAYEDVSFIPPLGSPAGAGTTLTSTLSRSFTVPAGAYDVYVVAKEPTPEKPPKSGPASKTSVLKQTITVPDFWSKDLNTSTVIVANRIDPLPAPLTPTQVADRPYALGQMEIVPNFDMKFTKKSELQTFLLIYNPALDPKDNLPNVTVEYNFCQIAAGGEAPKAGEPCKAGEKFFNRTNPQTLNAGTLPPGFDLNAGHQLQSGQAVPLGSFPEGPYRLEIKISDKVANKTITRDVNFTVSPS